MRIDRHANVVTCGYCRLSSFVHMPNRPAPPVQQGSANYGHIHVNEKALKTVGLVLVLTMVLPVVLILGALFIVLFFGSVAVCVSSNVKPRPSPPAPLPAAPAPITPGSGVSADCEKAVACCRVVLGATGQNASQQRTCEGLRAMPDDACAKQLDTFRSSAKSMGRTCPP